MIFNLDRQAIDLAEQNSLWVQGGVVDDPEMHKTFGSKYAFATLRCSVDNWNADNVEYAAYPSGYKNVFCYAYYVNSAPEAGTVTITKKVDGTRISQGFTFTSNLSYDPSGTFALQVNNSNPASQEFIRADSASFGGPYDVQEQVPGGWTLTDLTCSSTKSTSTWTIDKSTAKVAITLAAADHVTCIYTDSPYLPKSPVLNVWKVTKGGTGGPFTFGVAGPVSHTLTATTATAEVPQEATEGGATPTDYTPGDYTITEDLPSATAAGYWTFDQAHCDLHALAPTTLGGHPEIHVTLTADTGQTCIFRNTFHPNGRIVLRIKTIGGTGVGWFYLTSDSNPRPHPIRAETTQESVEVTVDDKSGLAFQSYNVQAVGAVTDPKKGTWSFVSFECRKGISSAPTPQVRTITLTASEPHADCLAVYRFTPARTVELTKTARGSAQARSGPAVVDIRCARLARGQVVLPQGSGSASLPEPLYLRQDVTCRVAEPRNGARAPQNWTARATVNGRSLPLPGSFDVRTSGPRSYRVTVDNLYRPARIPGS